MKLDTILVVLESSNLGEPLALRKALFLVQNSCIAIHVAYVVNSKDSEQTPQESLLSRAETTLGTLIKQECPNTPNISSEVILSDNTSDATKEVCDSRKIDLIIKTGHRSETLLHVPSDFHLLRVPRVPVLVLHDQAWNAAPVVLAAIDFDPRHQKQMSLSRKVLECARQVAVMENASLHCCHIIGHSKVLMDMDIVEPEEQVRKFRERHQNALSDLLEDYGIQPDQMHLLSGVPARLIPSLADELKADLVVIGTHHHTGLTGLVMGNTCEKILKVLRTGVLTVKPE